MPPTFKTYFLLLTTLVGAASAGLILFHVSVDPYGAYRSFSSRDYDRYRGDIESRTFMAENLQRGDWDTLLLGTSRTQVAIDPTNRIWQSDGVFSASLPGGRMYESLQSLRLASNSTMLRRVYLFVDFFSFGAHARFAYDFEDSRLNPEFNAVEYHLGNCIGLQGIHQSQEVLRRKRVEEAAPVNSRGFRYLEPRTVRRSSDHFRTVIENFMSTPSMYANFGMGEEQLESFRKVLELCRLKDIELTIAILPVHATLLETLRVMGLWETYEDWKRTLVAMLGTGSEFKLWDFTSYGSVTSESVSAGRSGLRKVHWFRDASHMAIKLGALVLKDILARDPRAAEYGVLIDRDNIEEHLTAITAQRRNYVRMNSGDIEFVKEIYSGLKDAAE